MVESLLSVRNTMQRNRQELQALVVQGQRPVRKCDDVLERVS